MSHGVNRATLKKGKSDSRIYFLNSLIKKINGINYDFYGFENKEPIWGDEFYNALTNSKMGLNLSRGLPTKYYTSNRIASLMGNGLLTFVDKKTQLNDFFKKDEISYGDLPNKYEAGTMATAQVIAFDQSIKFLEKIGINNIIKHIWRTKHGT